MKCKMLGTTDSRFQGRCGTIEESTFSNRNRIFWFGNLHTSYVIEYKINENIMIIKTRNSEYTFELLDNTKIEVFEEFKRSTDEIKQLEELCK